MKSIHFLFLPGDRGLFRNFRFCLGRTIFIAGKPSHAPLQHEHRAGCLLLQKCLVDIPGVITKVYDNGWPTVLKDGKPVDDNTAFEGVDAIIIYSDGGSGHPALQGDHLQLLENSREAESGSGSFTMPWNPRLPPDRRSSSNGLAALRKSTGR